MKKLFASLGVLCAVAVVAAVMSLSSAPDLTADPYCTEPTCAGTFQRTVGPVTGNSTVDCMWAVMDAKSQLNSQINCPIGFCDGPNYITTTPCNATSPYSVGMKATYTCMRCAGPFQDG